jgi:hypothetical protein
MGWRFAEYDEMVNFQPSASGKVNHLRGEATIWLGSQLFVLIETNHAHNIYGLAGKILAHPFHKGFTKLPTTI